MEYTFTTNGEFYRTDGVLVASPGAPSGQNLALPQFDCRNHVENYFDLISEVLAPLYLVLPKLVQIAPGERFGSATGWTEQTLATSIVLAGADAGLFALLRSEFARSEGSDALAMRLVANTLIPRFANTTLPTFALKADAIATVLGNVDGAPLIVDFVRQLGSMFSPLLAARFQIAPFIVRPAQFDADDPCLETKWSLTVRCS